MASPRLPVFQLTACDCSLAMRRRPRQRSASNAAGSLADELLEHRDEAPRRLELRQMADVFEDLEPAAGNRLVRFLAVVGPG